jgi:hypothetical protein
MKILLTLMVVVFASCVDKSRDLSKNSSNSSVNVELIFYIDEVLIGENGKPNLWGFQRYKFTHDFNHNIEVNENFLRISLYKNNHWYETDNKFREDQKADLKVISPNNALVVDRPFSMVLEKETIKDLRKKSLKGLNISQSFVVSKHQDTKDADKCLLGTVYTKKATWKFSKSFKMK